MNNEQQWLDATSDFLKKHPDWPGNPVNEVLMGDKIRELGLIYQPSVDSLQTAFDALTQEGMITPVRLMFDFYLPHPTPEHKKTMDALQDICAEEKRLVENLTEKLDCLRRKDRAREYELKRVQNRLNGLLDLSARSH